MARSLSPMPSRACPPRGQRSDDTRQSAGAIDGVHA
eukprot:CAMPEP_0202766376 /NCGR_PEP_ID=MMETSP1388-20130828/30423_1 /ASSEMBLY_ACC=CAM_ASM_000864 /TAXON_ID=37098 /ORGANISM="Isochrysis sp, Strain CCMP1244" /LENGTH=35 /DNA_ID= /DNA_START= /DNA_END= /DNA_ORIENTATION=